MAARKEYHHGNLRESLLAAAKELLGRMGPAGLSLRELARTAGVSPAAPYHHFATKQDLLLELAKAGFEDLDAFMAEAQAVAPNGALDQLLACGMGYILFARRHHALYKLMMQHEYTPQEGHASLMEAASCSYVRLENAVGKAVEARGRGQGGQVDAHLCWAVVHGLAGFYADKTLAAYLPENGELAHGRLVLTRLMDAFAK